MKNLITILCLIGCVVCGRAQNTYHPGGGTGTGSGTVTTIPDGTTNGVVWTVSTRTTVPTFTFSLTAITPTSVNGNTITTGTGTLTLGAVTLNAGGGGTLGSAAFTATSAYEVPLTFSTGLTRSTNTVTVNTSQNIATLSNLTTNGLVTTSGANGTLGVTAPGTGVLTALGVNIGSAGALVLFNGAGGTPSSVTLTNANGTAASLTAGNATLAANLSGTPAVPNGTTATTQSASDNSTKLATTAYVDGKVIGTNSINFGLTADTTTALTVTTAMDYVTNSNAATVTDNLPTLASAIAANPTKIYHFKNIGAGAVNLTPNGAETIFYTASGAAVLTLNTGEAVDLVATSTQWLAR